MPRSVSKVPRLGGRNRRAPASKVPRSVSVLPRSVSKVPRSSDEVPRSSLSTLSTLNDPIDPPRPSNRYAPPRVLSSSVVVSCQSPPMRGTILAPQTGCPCNVLVDPGWRENRRSPREAQTTPVRRLIVRGVVPLNGSGATPAKGGKPSAATSEQTRLTRNCRARFWAAQAARVAPVSREVR